MMYKAKYDLSVLMIFFTRPNTLKQVFAQVKKARPARLFLACDGPRENNSADAENIAECKAIVSDIDWECEVHTLDREENLGCGKGPSEAISWAFSHTDKLAILEDDCVPNDCFFPYMQELLEKYANDERVGMISGLNHFKNWDCGENSYCFTNSAAIWGWGTWKRVWDQYDYYNTMSNDKYCMHLFEMGPGSKRVAAQRIKAWRQTAKEAQKKKIQLWDNQFTLLMFSQSRLGIVPKHNLICNIGAGAGATHAQKLQETKWKPGSVLFMPTEALELPLKHPDYVVCDRYYDKKYFETMAFPHPIVRFLKRVKYRLLKR